MTETMTGTKRQESVPDVADFPIIIEKFSKLHSSREYPEERPWSTKTQEALLPILEAEDANGGLSKRDFDRILLAVFPETPLSVRRRTELQINFGTKNPHEIVARLDGRTTDSVNFCRAAGSDVLMLDNPEKIQNGERWEVAVERYLETGNYSKESLMALGDELAKKYGYDQTTVRRQVPQRSDKYTFTYHFETTRGIHDHPHCCGAHGNDTKRAMMILFAEASLLLWAHNGTKNIEFKSRRTRRDQDLAGLYTISDSLEEFAKIHFSSFTPTEAQDEKALEADGGVYSGIRHPALKQIHEAFTSLNKLMRGEYKPTSETIIGCVDDRVKDEIGPMGELIPSQQEHHVADLLYVTIGTRARNIISPQGLGTPRCYTANIAAGAQRILDIDSKEAMDSLLYQVPLIFGRVMDKNLNNRQLIVDIAVAGWPPNAQNDHTKAILHDPATLERAREKGIDVTKDVGIMSEEEIIGCLVAHEDVVADKVNHMMVKLIAEKLDKIDKNIIVEWRIHLATSERIIGGSRTIMRGPLSKRADSKKITIDIPTQ